MKHKLGSKVYFYEFGYTGNKFVGVVSGVKENFDGSYTVTVDTQGDLGRRWEMSSDFVYIIKC